MGAFFIVNREKVRSIEKTLSLFEEMGFSSPSRFSVGVRDIYIYPKMVDEYVNCIKQNGRLIFSNGTLVYKGKNPKESLQELAYDYYNGGIKFEQLYGQFSLFFCAEGKIKIIGDSLGCKHLFVDKENIIISSHMLAIAQTVPYKLHVNKKAIYEKLMTGIIMSPNTPFAEIYQINNALIQSPLNSQNDISFMQASLHLPPEKVQRQNKRQCINEQSDALLHYFSELKEGSDGGIDIGLSGGYDSRLVLACLNCTVPNKLHLHSHATENDHKQDLCIAKQMANHIGVPCNVIKTKRLSHCDFVNDVVKKSVLYFDGRSSFSIGGCGEVYTPQYRMASTEKTPMSITGIGGELYRNVYNINKKNIRFTRFMVCKVFSGGFRRAVSKELYNAMSQDIIRRAAQRLGISPKKRVSKAIAHRYYCEILMPDGQGAAIDAYNQVSACMAPFIEPEIIKEGYKSIPFHGAGGTFEGQLIDYIDTGLASLDSSYGYPLNNRSFFKTIKETVRGWIPDALWARLSGMKHRNDKEPRKNIAIMEELYANSSLLKESCEYLFALFPEIDFLVLLQSREYIRRIQFLATTIYLYGR